MPIMRSRRWISRSCSALLAASFVAAGTLAATPSPSGAAAKAPTSATWAELPQQVPSYIFPFMRLDNFSVANINQFQYLMYRPLYWFGTGGTPDLDPRLSLASVPVYSNGFKTVTISLKGWRWSNGETVGAKGVMFWMNMLHADKDQWANYTPGLSIPDGVRSVRALSGTKVQFELSAPVNELWFTSNQLSQITPLPRAWDKTSDEGTPGSGGCSDAKFGTADKQCNEVFTYLSRAAGFDPANPKAPNTALSSYASNPLWQVVDGPWRLDRFDGAGTAEFIPNKKYSGPVKPTIKRFIERLFVTDGAEYEALTKGQIDVGYLPSAKLSAPTKQPASAGPNDAKIAKHYVLDPLYFWSINYFPYNFNSTGNEGNAGKIFRQLYFRQAFQTLINQPLYISKFWKNYGFPTTGPVPAYPKSSWTSEFDRKNPYPYDVAKARSLLSTHGWKVVPGGTSTCVKPGRGAGRCGEGIPAKAKLSFNLEYATAAGATLVDLMKAEKASWSQAGINVSLSGAPFQTVLGKAVPCKGGAGCEWELENWGGGWVFAPDYYPSGELLFQSKVGYNSGSYANRRADQLIAASTRSNTSLSAYDSYISSQLPVVFQPNPVTSLTEIRKGLRGVTPQSPLYSLTPEAWRF